MATNKPRYTVSVDDELFEKIEDFRFANRYNTRAEATVALLEIGLKALDSLSPEELSAKVQEFKKTRRKNGEG